MMSKHPDLAAFPFDIENTYDKPIDIMGVEIMPGGRVVSVGMSLRDYFAAKALPQCIAEYGMTGLASVAEAAYRYADAMLEARK